MTTDDHMRRVAAGTWADGSVIREQIRARLDEIAPWPDRDPAPENVARWLLVHAQREWVSHIVPTTMLDGPAPETLDVTRVAKLNAQFAAAHALLALSDAAPREAAEQAARDIALAWNDGAATGVWIWEHLDALGVDPDEVARLEQARMALNKTAGDEKADEPASSEADRDARLAELIAKRYVRNDYRYVRQDLEED